MNNQEVNDAVSKLRDYNDDERARELAFKRERAITDYNHRFEKGVEKGIEKGIAIGEAKGIAIGEAKGIAIGEAKGIAKSIEKLLVKGFSTQKIADILDLAVNEVEEIINSNGNSDS